MRVLQREVLRHAYPYRGSSSWPQLTLTLPRFRHCLWPSISVSKDNKAPVFDESSRVENALRRARHSVLLNQPCSLAQARPKPGCATTHPQNPRQDTLLAGDSRSPGLRHHYRPLQGGLHPATGCRTNSGEAVAVVRPQPTKHTPSIQPMTAPPLSSCFRCREPVRAPSGDAPYQSV